jgi:hypothetical protein
MLMIAKLYLAGAIKAPLCLFMIEKNLLQGQ